MTKPGSNSMNIHKFIFTAVFQLIGLATVAQLTQPQLDSVVKKFTQDLNKKGVDTVCIYEEYCIGCLFYSSKGENFCLEKISFLPTYIFWKQKGKTFVTKKDACFDYSTQSIPNDSFWDYYFTNKEKIKKEELKTPGYIEIVNGKEKVHSIDIDHSVFFRIILNTRNETLTKDINSFYFTKELGANEEKNINYDYNMATSLNVLHSIFQKIIKQDLIKKKFIETMR